MGFDPCLVVKEDYMFSEYSKISVEFQPEDINGNLLPLEFCQVHECGLHLLYKDGIHDLIMPDCFRFYSLDRDGLEAMFQTKRERFQSMSWEDYYAMRLTHEFLGSLLEFQLYSGELYRMFLFFSICHVSF